MQTDASVYILTGILLGLGAGFTPGPLLVLVIAETLKHGKRAGLQVSVTPLLTDLPIILLSTWLLTRVAATPAILGVLTLAGAAFLLYLGWDSLRFSGASGPAPATAGSPLSKGLAVNILNPHPYLFWITLGGPTVLAAARLGVMPPILFVAVFYTCLVGAKIFLTLALDLTRPFLSSRPYVYGVRLIGAAYLILALFFIRGGLARLGTP